MAGGKLAMEVLQEGRRGGGNKLREEGVHCEDSGKMESSEL